MKSLVLITLLVAFGMSAMAQDPVDARAQAISEKTVTALGGRERLEAIRYLRFDFVVEVEGNVAFKAHHLWDRRKGRYRLEWEDEGRQVQTVFNVNALQTGCVWINGEPVPEADRQPYIDQAHYFFLNDNYWLFMPLKMQDPGVILAYEGEHRIDGKAYDLVHLRFQNVGLTPGDQHWAYVNRETGLVERSAYYLERYEGTPFLEDGTVWIWDQWKPVAGLLLARERRLVHTTHESFTSARLSYPLLTVLTNVDDGAFEDPTVTLPQ